MTITISSFRCQNTRKRSLKVTSRSSGGAASRSASLLRGDRTIPFVKVAQPRRLLVAAQPLDGGVARHVIALVGALPRDRFAVDVACPRTSTTWAELEGVPRVELHAIRPHR